MRQLLRAPQLAGPCICFLPRSSMYVGLHFSVILQDDIRQKSVISNINNTFHQQYYPAYLLLSLLCSKMGFRGFINIFTSERIQKPRTERFFVLMLTFTPSIMEMTSARFRIYAGTFAVPYNTIVTAFCSS